MGGGLGQAPDKLWSRRSHRPSACALSKGPAAWQATSGQGWGRDGNLPPPGPVQWTQAWEQSWARNGGRGGEQA